MANLNFYFDPVCPFAWMTSKWVRMVAAQRDYQVDWRFISLKLVNADKGYAPEVQERYEKVHGLGFSLLSMTTAMGQVERGLNRIYGIRRDRPAVSKYGRAAVITAVLAVPIGLGFLLVVAGVFFELVLNIGGLVDSSVAPFVVPGLLILAGAYVLWRGNPSRPKKSQWL